MNILIADKLASEGLKILEAAVRVENCAGISATELIEIVKPHDALIVRSRTKVSAQVIDAAPRLKVIGRGGVGVDNVDLLAAREREIIVVNAPTASTESVAELTIGLMLTLSRDITRANSAVKGGEWNKKKFLGLELYKKTLGIIGIGNIGSNVAAIANALGMKVLAYDALCTPEMIEQLGATPVTLERLYSQSDLISLHTPLTAETRNIIDYHALEQMKPGAYIICTARGGLIDEGALVDALESGQVAGAALDVFAHEPPGQPPLVTHPNVICTPHIGAQTAEAQKRVAVNIAEEVLAALRGDPLRWRVV